MSKFACAKERDVCGYFRNLTPELAQQFVNVYSPIWKGTIGDGDGLWIPPGHMFMELSCKTGVLGMKLAGYAAVNADIINKIAKFHDEEKKQPPQLFTAMMEDACTFLVRAFRNAVIDLR